MANGEDDAVIDVVCALITDANGRLLACKRSEGSHLGGHWEFPGGKVEAGENPAEAIRREIEEELGVVIEVGAQLQPVEWSDANVSIRLIPFCCILTSGEPHPHEHEEVRWCGADELQELNWAPADIPILEEWLSAEP